MIILTLIDLNPAELNYYPFMISLDKCNGIDYLYMRHVNSTWDRVHFRIHLLNHNSSSCQTWPIDRFKQGQ